MYLTRPDSSLVTSSTEVKVRLDSLTSYRLSGTVYRNATEGTEGYSGIVTVV